MRVSAELVSVPAGDIWWSQTTQVPLDAVIDLHDELARRVIASLPLTAQDRNYRPRAAGNAKAFESLPARYAFARRDGKSGSRRTRFSRKVWRSIPGSRRRGPSAGGSSVCSEI
jgi:hypothetical protein